MLAKILEGKEDTIAERWATLVFETYPRETTQFLKGEGDPFANPVGKLLRDASRPLVRALSEEWAGAESLEDLAELMRLRSIQDMTAAHAVGIVPLLRRAVIDVVGDRIDDAGVAAVEELGKRIERLMLISFDAFVISRERLYEIRMAERERHTGSLLRRAEKVLAGSQTPETGGGCHGDNPAAVR